MYTALFMTAKKLNEELKALVDKAAKAGFKLELRGSTIENIHFHPGWFDGYSYGSASLQFQKLTKSDCQYGTE